MNRIPHMNREGSQLEGSMTLVYCAILPRANLAARININQQMLKMANSWKCICKMKGSLSFHSFSAIPLHCLWTNRKYYTNWRSREITPDFNPSDEIHYLHSFGSYKLCFSIVNTIARNRRQSSTNHSVWMLALFWKRNGHKQTTDLPMQKFITSWPMKEN